MTAFHFSSESDDGDSGALSGRCTAGDRRLRFWKIADANSKKSARRMYPLMAVGCFIAGGEMDGDGAAE